MMDRTMKTITQIVGILAVFAVMGVALYMVGSMQVSDILQNAPEIQEEDWMSSFVAVAVAAAGGSCLFALAWFADARWGTAIVNPTGLDKRKNWLLYWVLSAAAGVGMLYATAINLDFTDTARPDVVICAAAVLFLGCIGYYVSTLFFTPSKYKYTPIGAMRIRKALGI